MKKFAVSFTEIENGIVTHAGTVKSLFSSAEEASDFCIAESQKIATTLKAVYNDKHINDPSKFSLDITNDECDGKDLPVLTVLRNWNGLDYDMHIWVVTEIANH